MPSRRHALSLALALPALVFFTPNCALLPQKRTSSMGALMVERLSWMDEVAAVKQAKGLPIFDAAREAEVLNAMEQKGAAVGIPAKAVRGFFAGQMAAAKTFQMEWLKANPRPTTSSKALLDLGKTVRPALDDISTKMIATLAALRSAGSKKALGAQAEAGQALMKAGYSSQVRNEALQGLVKGLQP